MRGLFIVAIILALAMAAGSAILLPLPYAWGGAACCGALLLLLVLIWRYAVKPVRRIVEGMGLLRSQDFASRLRPVGQRDADSLSAIFNMMMDTLHRERTRLLEQGNYLGLLVEASPMGVVNLDASGRVTSLNPAAIELLELPSNIEPIIGSPLAELPSPLASRLGAMGDGESATLRVGSNVVGATLGHFIDRGMTRPFLMLVSLDREMREAERRGYSMAIRTMAHEISNSVGAVDSTLQTLAEMVEGSMPPGEDCDDSMGLIRAARERLASSAAFINSFATLARLPKPVKATVDMGLLMRRLEPIAAALCRPSGVSLSVTAPVGQLVMDADEGQIEQVVVNLVKNAVESIAETGRSDGRVELRVDRHGFYVTDNGHGISSEQAAEVLSTPFLTTKDGGQGIGLTLSCEILHSHGLRPSLVTDLSTGLTTFAARR
ncbi:MAG: ATP-binding protein [Pseudoflavonifractor sp.]|nr:ATP-binding protein [Alloprevotella sp.]MCM1116027.1 ATP-binding protein [Pseudoflavonifractor sp.]